jgi:hypothetical protein
MASLGNRADTISKKRKKERKQARLNAWRNGSACLPRDIHQPCDSSVSLEMGSKI